MVFRSNAQCHAIPMAESSNQSKNIHRLAMKSIVLLREQQFIAFLSLCLWRSSASRWAAASSSPSKSSSSSFRRRSSESVLLLGTTASACSLSFLVALLLLSCPLFRGTFWNLRADSDGLLLMVAWALWKVPCEISAFAESKVPCETGAFADGTESSPESSRTIIFGLVLTWFGRGLSSLGSWPSNCSAFFVEFSGRISSGGYSPFSKKAQRCCFH